MAIKPSPTIAGKLRKLFSNNKQTIEPAIGDSVPGGGGGGRFDVNITANDDTFIADKTLTQIVEAYQSGMVVVLNDLVEYTGSCVAAITDGDIYGNVVRIYKNSDDTSTVMLVSMFISSDGVEYDRAYLDITQ